VVKPLTDASTEHLQEEEKDQVPAETGTYELPEDDEVHQTRKEPAIDSKPPAVEDQPMTLSQLGSQPPRDPMKDYSVSSGPPLLPPPVKSVGYSVPAESFGQREDALYVPSQGMAQSHTVSAAERGHRSQTAKKASRGKKQRPLKSVNFAQRRATTPSVYRVFQDHNSMPGPPQKSRQQHIGSSQQRVQIKIGKHSTGSIRGSIRPTSASTRKPSGSIGDNRFKK